MKVILEIAKEIFNGACNDLQSTAIVIVSTKVWNFDVDVYHSVSKIICADVISFMPQNWRAIVIISNFNYFFFILLIEETIPTAQVHFY